MGVDEGHASEVEQQAGRRLMQGRLYDAAECILGVEVKGIPPL
ncbi:hypothetical protein ACQP1V_28970 [Microtetraspora malaysiensis]